MFSRIKEDIASVFDRDPAARTTFGHQSYAPLLAGVVRPLSGDIDSGRIASDLQ